MPLAAGCLLIPLLVVLRRHLKETTAFTRRERSPRLGEIGVGLWQARCRVALGMMMVLMSTVSFYIITAYTPTFGKLLHLPERDNLIVTAAVGVSNFCWLPVMGALSDRIGRRPILIGATVLAILTAYPAMAWLVAAPSVARLAIVLLWLSALYGSYNGAVIVYLTEVIPATVSATGFSLAYSLATAVGGFSPFIVTWLGSRTHDPAIVGAWLAGAAAISLAAVMLLGGRRAATATSF